MDALAHALALAFLAGDWEHSALVARGETVLGDTSRWLRPVVRKVLDTFARPPHVDLAPALAAVIESVASYRRARVEKTLSVRRWVQPAVTMLPARHPWTVPVIATPGDLAAWLGVATDRLEGYADLHGINLHADAARVRHYRVRWVAKKSGGWRALEVPKASLKSLQRKVLDGILAHVPAHPAAHGFVRGRSSLTHARAHVGRAVVLRLDLADFFPSVHGSRVRAIFREAGYPDAVAARLAGLCCTRLARAEWRLRPASVSDAAWRRLREPHLAQGAPTSPALANLAAFALDRRLAALALAFGATYTRYADDLTFSGDASLHPRLGRFRAWVERVIEDEGFALRHAKTRVMPQDTAQQVTGLVVNARPNVPREDYDRLRATLHRCATRGVGEVEGVTGGDLRAHLLGRIAHVAATHARRGAKLRAMFDQIEWPRGTSA